MKEFSKAQALEVAELGPYLVLSAVSTTRKKLFNFFESQLFSPSKMANTVQRFSAVSMKILHIKYPADFSW